MQHAVPPMSTMKLPANGVASDVEACAPPAVDGLVITFKDLTYIVDSSNKKGEKAQLLTNVSGYLKPGEVGAHFAGVCQHTHFSYNGWPVVLSGTTPSLQIQLGYL
jgi:hypothetical protein